MGGVLLIEPYLITNCVKNWSIFRTPFPSCAADAQRAVPCALSALIGFFVFGAVLCGPLGRIRSGRGLIFSIVFCGNFSPLHPREKIKEGARRPRLWRFKGKGIQGKGGNRNPPFSWCVFGYFLHKQKVTEVPGRAALGDGVTARAAIKSKTNRNPPQKIKKKMVA